MSPEKPRMLKNQFNEQLSEPPDTIRAEREHTLPSGEKIILSRGARIVLDKIRTGSSRQSVFDIAQSIPYAGGNLPVTLFYTFLDELRVKLKETGTRIAGKDHKFDPKKKFLRVKVRKKRRGGE